MRIQFFIRCALLVIFFIHCVSGPAISRQNASGDSAPLSLTPTESTWLHNHRVIRVGMWPVFPPLKFTENGVVKGIEADYLELLAKLTGIRFEFVITDFASMDEKLKKGELDMFLSFSIPQRLEYVSFTVPFMDAKSVLVTSGDSPVISGLSTLAGKRVATVRGVKLYEKILASYPEITVLVYEDMEQMFRAVDEGRADALISKTIFAGYLIKNFPRLKIAGTVEHPPEPYLFAVRKDYPELLSILNNAINSIPQEQHEAIIQKWFNVRIEYRPQKGEIAKWVLLTSAVFLSFIAVGVYFNRRLKDEIRRRVASEQELLNNRQLLDTMSHIARIGGWELDLATNQHTWTKEVYQIHEVGTEFSPTLERALSYYTPESVSRINGSLQKTIETGEGFDLELDMISAQGRHLKVQAIGQAEKVNGVVVKIFGTVRDITLQHAAEMQLQLMQQQVVQQEKLATIGQLAAGVAHEINNPVGFVSSNMESLRRYADKYNQYIDVLETELCLHSGGVLPEKADSARHSLKIEYISRDTNGLLEECSDGLKRVMTIVQDLRAFSRAGSPDLENADLNKCIDGTLNIVMNEIKYSADVVKDYGRLPLVPFNIQHISQVVMNLLVNASHAIQATGSDRGIITLRTWCDGSSAYLLVSDTGCGIPPELCSRIFDPFFTTKDVGKGTGLGLSISYDILKRHGGYLAVQSQVGVGTTFTVRLPISGGSDSDLAGGTGP